MEILSSSPNHLILAQDLKFQQLENFINTIYQQIDRKITQVLTYLQAMERFSVVIERVLLVKK